MAEAVALGTTADAAAAAVLGPSVAAGATGTIFGPAAVPPLALGPGGGWTKQVTCRYALLAAERGGGVPSPPPPCVPPVPLSPPPLPPTRPFLRAPRPSPLAHVGTAAPPTPHPPRKPLKEAGG